MLSPSAWPAAVWRSLSGVGLLLGTLFFAAALTPTLIPRTYVTQGVLAGAAFALGYGLGVFWRWLWSYLGLPEVAESLRRRANLLVIGTCLVVGVAFLARTTDWQNSVRAGMGMDPVSSANPLLICLVAIVTFLALLVVGRLFKRVFYFSARQVNRFVPPRVANLIGAAIAILLFWSLAADVLFRGVMEGLDSSYAQLDALMEPERERPDSPLKTGGPQSLVGWKTLGRAGREFIAAGPRAGDIAAMAGGNAMEPIRVYVGLKGAETTERRARLALDELKRVGAFERSVLVVITPTGTGWIDPAAIDSVEYLHRGDIASVALQYSYLASPLSLITHPEYGFEAARALFLEIYAYWTTLPKERRPKLYLHGLSLGAMNSQRSVDLFDMLADPIQGMLWSGPPFVSELWRSVTRRRNEGSPAWLPEFRDSSMVRFMNQNGSPLPADQPWGPLRIVYLQYASDSVTFFDYHDLYRQPAWMDLPRGPDVSPLLRWYPIVTMLQLALDMLVATTTPIGYGHVYAPQHYIDAWREVADVQGWSPEEIDRLKSHLLERMTGGSSTGSGTSARENRGG